VYDVVVLGAGAAGLAAARHLVRRSLRVAVLEARDRVGGRILSVPSPRRAIPAELGAEFIHGPAEATLRLLREAGTTSIASVGESWAPGANGELQREDDDVFRSANSIFDRARDLDVDESVERFLRRFDGDETQQEIAATARAFVEGFDAADPAIAGVRGIAQEWSSGVDSTSARPLGAYPPIVGRLFDDCEAGGAMFHLSTVVRRVTWHRGEVEIECTMGRGAPQKIRAKAAIVTLPAGVLRSEEPENRVIFEPELPPAKRRALASIETGDVVKVVLWFHSPFWERLHDGRYREAAFFRAPTGPFPAYWTQFPLRSESVVAWAGGPKATELEALSDAERIDRALEGFSDLLGERELASSEFERGTTHDWRRDPFARGAYSYLGIGAGNARATLGESIDGTLYFAGESASNDGQGGTVNGAIETGERAAEEAADSLAEGNG
jgi:monoamine oxidase